ncbi:FAD/NAD(P)-binding domain-containing protein [Meredithblackwellia eburnea MCA 4105]
MAFNSTARARLPNLSGSVASSSASLAKVALSRRAFSVSAIRDKQKLVILGSGWAGYEVMRKVDKKRYDVSIISPNSYFAFTPLLASTAVGTLEFRCALEPVRRYGERVVSYQAWCDSIDFKNKTLHCMPATSGVHLRETVQGADQGVGAGDQEKKALMTRSGKTPTEPPRSYPGTKSFQVSYDKLVIAVGAYSQTFNTPGVKEYAHFLKDVKDARKIRSRILECFEQASQPTLTDTERKNLLHFVIVGGGPTGVEFAAELHDLLASDIRRHFPVLSPMAKITVYDVAPKILASFDGELVDYAVAQFKRQGVEIRNNRHVTAVHETSMEIKEEGTVNFGMLVWSTGLCSNPLITSVKELKHDPKTKGLEVDDQLRTVWEDGTTNRDVYCIGDASSVVSERLPATAQVANQQAKYIAKRLNAIVANRTPPESFEFNNAGIMTYIGNWNALLDRSGAKSGPKPKEAGRLAWLLWRSAYWSQALSWRNKFSLAFYWFLNWGFGRDVTRF